ncbi:hypothetical protein CANCADRAFT_32336 [Tortispora caseinolytica NRRL Y-17796]|uniref:Mitochondrial carrier protein LEU5 n=1 Tax=Tortispora caseinolytica NRRL Y-17796 TaxID=767744 RepID=A0A1E4TAT7_9ASCO|nr:hypothetical protein CANCADRAFT_32336 [Tortispora caseinolytica NRRL Y-17796]
MSTQTQTPAEIADRPRISKHSWEYVVRSGIAGGLAGSAAKTAIAPLDRVKILFQTSNEDFLQYRGSLKGTARAISRIYRDSGVYGLFQGHSVTIVRIMPYAAIKFVAYEQVRNFFIPSKEYETHIRRAISGSLSGIVSVMFTYPLEVIRVRMAYESKIHHHHETPVTHFSEHGVLATTRRIYANGGLHNFYRGFSATVIGIIPYAGVSFWTHDFAHDLLRLPAIEKYTTIESESLDRPPLKVWAELTAGGLSGMVAQTASYPLEVIRRRMQVHDGSRQSIIGLGKEIVRVDGFKGLYVGLSIGFIKVVPMAAISFLVYERVKFALGI